MERWQHGLLWVTKLHQGSAESNAGSQGDVLELANVGDAWKAATPEECSKLARCPFEEVWLRKELVVTVTPRPEFERLLELSYKDFVTHANKLATPRGIKVPKLRNTEPLGWPPV